MRTFSQMLQAIRRSDDVLREAVSEAATYILRQYHNNGRKVDGAGVSLRAQFVQALPAWLQKEAGRWQLDSGKRVLDMSEREAQMRADAFIGVAFASQEEKRRIAKENREARKLAKAHEAPTIAPESTNESSEGGDTIEGEFEVVEAQAVGNALVIDGHMIELDADEASALVTILTQMRERAVVERQLLAA